MKRSLFTDLGRLRLFDIKIISCALITELLFIGIFFIFDILIDIIHHREIVIYFKFSSIQEIIFNVAVLYVIIYSFFLERRQKMIQKQLYESLFKYNLHPTFMADERGRLVKINKAGEEIYGYKNEEIVNINFKEFMTKEEGTRSQEAVNLVLKGSPQKRETIVYHKDGHEILTEINAIPITIGNKVVGIIGFSKDITAEKNMKQSLEEANKYLTEVSERDGLTGIKNRGYFNKEIKAQWEKAIMEKSSLTVILLDVDFFKNYNDTYGHLLGDKCLKEIAERISNTIRQDYDFLCRYGGEELIIILTQTSCKEALVIGERIRRNIESLKIPHVKSEVSNFVTVSLGVSSMIPREGDSYEELIIRADEAVYMSKRSGRNKVTLFKCEEVKNS